MQKSHKDLYIILNQSRASGRDCLQGILRFSESRPEWRTHLYEPDEHGFRETMQAMTNGIADGVLTLELENPDFANCLERTTVPLVVVGTRKACLPKRQVNLSIVSIDEEKIGAFTAQQVLHLGQFKSIGYIGCTDEKRGYLSELRHRGIINELGRHHCMCTTYDPKEEMSRWLQRLETPAAVIGCIDDRATNVLRVCDKMGIRVPEAIRVIGIDNSEYICQTSYPTLSSISVNVIEEGFAAAAELDRLIRRRKPLTQRKIYICSTRCAFVQRNSTCVLAPGLQLVNRAIEYITTHADGELTVDRVINHLRVSKRLLYLRFREFSDKSLHELIVEKRLDYLKRQLLSSRRSIHEITTACGFVNPTHIKTLFKRKTGCTLSEWRKRVSGGRR